MLPSRPGLSSTVQFFATLAAYGIFSQGSLASCQIVPASLWHRKSKNPQRNTRPNRPCQQLLGTTTTLRYQAMQKRHAIPPTMGLIPNRRCVPGCGTYRANSLALEARWRRLLRRHFFSLEITWRAVCDEKIRQRSRQQTAIVRIQPLPIAVRYPANVFSPVSYDSAAVTRLQLERSMKKSESGSNRQHGWGASADQSYSNPCSGRSHSSVAERIGRDDLVPRCSAPRKGVLKA